MEMEMSVGKLKLDPAGQGSVKERAEAAGAAKARATPSGKVEGKEGERHGEASQVGRGP